MEKIYFLDDNNNIVDEKNSTHFYIQKYDEKGNMIEHFHYDNSKNKTDKVKITYTKEEEEMFNNVDLEDGSHPFSK